MMKITVFVLTTTSAAAFVPTPASKTASVPTALRDDLWGKDGDKPKGEEMSKALPFVARPKILDGTLPGDAGFDPFGFGGQDKAALMNMREAEIKHGRLAMLACVGWPLAELYDKPIAALMDKPALLTNSGESPSVLNGGLDKIDVAYWVGVFSLAGIIELENMKMKEEKGKNYIPGDCNFDPLGFFPKERQAKFDMQLKEIKNGRLAMMAILGFVAQEALYGVPVVQETPIFFTPASIF